MTFAVCHVSDEIHILAVLAAEQAVNGFYDNLDYVDVLPLVEAADVICVCYFSIVEDDVDGPCMVLDIQPVPHVLALAVDGQRLLVTDVVYK